MQHGSYQGCVALYPFRSFRQDTFARRVSERILVHYIGLGPAEASSYGESGGRYYRLTKDGRHRLSACML